MYTINQVAKRFGLSRSTLLYYDRVALLRPSKRSDANYRLYSDEDLRRMEKIATYREAGLQLGAIAEILDTEDSRSVSILEQRLQGLNEEIRELRQQQQLILKLLGGSLQSVAGCMNKAQWVGILKATGMDEADMHRWHMIFERDLPEAHADFLASLGIDADEIQRIRAWSKPEDAP